MEATGEEKSEKSEAEIEEVSKKYEDFTQEDFKKHLEDTRYAVETNTQVSREFFEKFPVFTIHEQAVDSVFCEESAIVGEINVGSKVRSLYTKRKDCDDV